MVAKISPWLIMGISFLVPGIALLGGAIWGYLGVKRFNKYGIITYGEVIDYEIGMPDIYDIRYGSYGPHFDRVYLKFTFEGREQKGTMLTVLPLFKKNRDKYYAPGAKRKIKILKNKNGAYDIRELRENKENVPYVQAIVLGILTVPVLTIAIWGLVWGIAGI